MGALHLDVDRVRTYWKIGRRLVQMEKQKEDLGKFGWSQYLKLMERQYDMSRLQLLDAMMIHRTFPTEEDAAKFPTITAVKKHLKALKG